MQIRETGLQTLINRTGTENDILQNKGMYVIFYMCYTVMLKHCNIHTF
jgi:hypothetical protein